MQIKKAGKETAGFIDSGKNTQQPVLNEVRDALRRIKFGEILITIHGGRVVQIEVREKKRFDNGETKRR